MQLYNSLGRKLEPFKPISADSVKLYTCGPTVYDYAHIGNLRSFVFDDTLRRALQVFGYKVKHVMNITDVGHLVSDDDEGEDKLERGAGREHKSVQEIAKLYTQAFLNDVDALNILAPNAYSGPHGAYALATDFIAEQVDIIRLLVEKQFAYQTEAAIYFDVAKLDDYGKLSGQKLSEKEVAARQEVVTDPNKRHPQDFALWFFTVGRFASHSLHWPSLWGEGFPGWHLECSAIIHATLGEPIDIHTGGVDHIGTHHANEIAQTEAAFDKQLANYWLHNEHLLVDGRRMSKSERNYYTLQDIIDRGYEPLALRMMYLQSHYRTQSNFSWEGLEAAAAYLQALGDWADLVHQQPPAVGPEQLSGVSQAVFDDLNTPRALAGLSGLGAPSREALELLDELLGLDLAKRAGLNPEQKQLIQDRETARKDKDWDLADKLRQQLIGQGIELNDSQDGPIWRRVKAA